MDSVRDLAQKLLAVRAARDRTWATIQSLNAARGEGGDVTRAWQDAVGLASAQHLDAQRDMDRLSAAIVAAVCRTATDTPVAGHGV